MDNTSFLRTIIDQHLTELLAPCSTCHGTRKMRGAQRKPLDFLALYVKPEIDINDKNQIVEVDCTDCDKPRHFNMGSRLVFADWLEEQGDLWAELIRVGVELAGLPYCLTPSVGAMDSDRRPLSCRELRPKKKADCLPWCKACTLQIRHDELLSRHGRDWTRIVLGKVWPKEHLFWKDAIVSVNMGKVATIGWYAGFPADFTVPLDLWRGSRCTCGRSGMIFSDGLLDCFSCRRISQADPLGPKLLAAAPIRKLRFAGKVPWTDNRGWFWWPEYQGQHNPEHRIPDEYESLHHHPFDTEELAYDALARVAINEQAGLLKNYM